METYSILDAARIVGRTKSTVRHHIKKMPPEMILHAGKEVRLTEEGLSMLRESVNQVTDSRELVHEPPVNHLEPPVNQVMNHLEPVQDVRELVHEPGQAASVNQVAEDREPPVNHLEDRLRDMAHTVENLTAERDSLQKEVDSLHDRIAILEASMNDLRQDKERYYNAMMNAQRLHDQEQRIHVQDVALLSRKRLPVGGTGTFFDRIKNVFTGKRSDEAEHPEDGAEQ